MKENVAKILDDMITRYPALNECREDIANVYTTCKTAYDSGKKLLICGNGGSAADSEHIVGELMKSFKKKRAVESRLIDKLNTMGEDGKTVAECLEGSLPAIALTSHISLSTAFANDREPTMTFAQQLLGLGLEGDVLIAISTSGNSTNCVYAALLAKAKGMTVVSLTGNKESRLSTISDITVKVPACETYLIQEYHLPIYHALCAMLEENFF